MRWLRALHRRLLPGDRSVGWLPYLWLVYLFFFFIRYFFVKPSATEAVAVGMTLLVFLGLYFNGFWHRGWTLVLHMAGLSLLGTAWAPVNPGASVFFIYATAFAGHLGPIRRAVVGMIAVVAWAMVVAWAWQPSVWFWFPALVFGTLIGVVNIYEAAKSRQNAELRLSQQEVRQLARVAERERISRDLHDLLGHTLSVITLKAELAGQLVDRNPARAKSEIRQVEEVSRAALAQVREAVSGFRARGLPGELEQAELALKAVAVDFVTDGAPPPLAPADEAVLALVLREAVTNVIRHAQATSCRILLRAEAGEGFLEVRDDGRGGRITAGGGIEGMRARLAAVGGRLEVTSDRGTRVRAWLPLTPVEEAAR